MAPNPRRQDAKLQALYDRVPAVPGCDGSCHGACCFIEPSPRERARMEQASGRTLETIDVHQSPAKAAALGWAPIVANGDGRTASAGFSRDGTRLARHRCSMLTHDGRCSVYALRPMICRLFGAGPGGLRCHRGCEPERRLTAIEVAELLLRAMDAGGGWPDGLPRRSTEDIIHDLEDPEVLASYQAQLAAQDRPA